LYNNFYSLKCCMFRLTKAPRVAAAHTFVSTHALVYNTVNKRPNLMQQNAFIYCKVTLHVSGITAPIIRSSKNCNRYLWYRS